MKKLVIIGLITLLLFGCAEQTQNYSDVSINSSRLDFISQEDTQNNIVASKDVDKIIEHFNELCDEEKEITDYIVAKDEYGYIVTVSDGRQYRIGVNENGVITAITLLTGSNSEQEAFNLIASKLIGKDVFKPHSFDNDAQDVLKKIDAISQAISSHY